MTKLENEENKNYNSSNKYRYHYIIVFLYNLNNSLVHKNIFIMQSRYIKFRI